MNVILITPPVVQVNAPYPSGAYLNAFFKSQNCNSIWYDLNIKLFYSIFSSAGLTRLFQLSSANALRLAEKAEKQGDEATAFNLRRYVSTSQNWIDWIDWITAILCDGQSTCKKGFSTREKQHQFLYSPFAPRGNRMLNHLGTLKSEPTVDDVRMLCSLALADLSDYITIAFDRNYSLIRYAESLAVDERDFSQIQAQLNSPVMENFYRPVLNEIAEHVEKQKDEKILMCISVPFGGTLLPALYTAKYFKQLLGNSVQTVIGGGFVNTELRNASQPELAEYVDAISYDRGYGSYYELLNQKEDGASIFKLRQFKKNTDNSINVIEPVWEKSDVAKIEDSFTKTITPDYSDIDFSIYPRVTDDTNPMHRLWTDGAWVKAYLAHGCYWHKCAFCDTQLDYVCSYLPVGVEKLYQSLADTALQKGVYGVHFVDEALPPAMLKQFALKNLQQPGSRQLYYWGNVRFEKTFTKDLAAFLSSGGFAAVSAGLEVATGLGLKNINKGTDVQSIVAACAAFKEAGILVHAYMIYGFWYDTPQTIIDSMETLRQFFAAGLLDSAFWHKFVLTRNSQVYSEWEKGMHPDLKPVDPLKNKSGKRSGSDNCMFAQNNLHFEKESSYDKYGQPLEIALNAWMHGEGLQTKVQKWFDFPVPVPSIPRNYIEQLIEKYEQNNNKPLPLPERAEGLYWLGSKPVISGNSLAWIYLLEENSVIVKQFCKKSLDEAQKIIWSLRPQAAESERSHAIEQIKNSNAFLPLLQELHNIGLVCV